jgi:hypothetical protein
LREGRLEDILALCQSYFAHKCSYARAAFLRQLGQGFYARDIHLFHLPPKQL